MKMKKIIKKVEMVGLEKYIEAVTAKRAGEKVDIPIPTFEFTTEEVTEEGGK